MPRVVFGPRRPIALSPDGPPPPPSRQPGVVVTARETVPPGYPFAGAVVARSGPARPLTPQQQPGRVLVAAPEPPPPAATDGRTAVAPWGLVQPVRRPTPAAILSPENPAPEAGRVVRSGSRPPTEYLPTARPVVARAEESPPFAGSAVRGPVGFGVPRVPARPLVASPEVRAPAPGAALVGKPPPPDLTRQQRPTVVLIATVESPPPFAGWCLVRVRPRVPSDRIAPRAVVARAEQPLPFPGSVLAWRMWFGHPAPARFVATVARTEERPPFPGACVTDGPGGDRVVIVPSQMPGRVLVARVEPPRPEEGRTVVLTGLRPGARPPSLGCACD